MDIGTIDELGGTVFHLEDKRPAAFGFAGEKWIRESLRNRQGDLTSGSRKAAPPACDSRDCRGGGAYDINGYDRPSRPILAHAFRKIIDDDGFPHGAHLLTDSRV